LFDGVSFGNGDGPFQGAAIKREPGWMNCKRSGQTAAGLPTTKPPEGGLL